MSVKCTKCNNTGYDHIIDMTGVHYDMTETEDPILRSQADSNHARAMCSDCLDKFSEGKTVEQVREHLYMR